MDFSNPSFSFDNTEEENLKKSKLYKKNKLSSKITSWENEIKTSTDYKKGLLHFACLYGCEEIVDCIITNFKDDIDINSTLLYIKKFACYKNITNNVIDNIESKIIINDQEQWNKEVKQAYNKDDYNEYWFADDADDKDNDYTNLNKNKIKKKKIKKR